MDTTNMRLVRFSNHKKLTLEQPRMTTFYIYVSWYNLTHLLVFAAIHKFPYFRKWPQPLKFK